MPKFQQTLRILLTGIGAPGSFGTIHMLAAGAKRDGVRLKLFGVDSQANAGLPRGCSFAGLVPDPSNREYLSKLVQIVEDLKIDILIPQTTRENEFLSRHFSMLPCRVLVPDFQTSALLNNKATLLRSAATAGCSSTEFSVTSSRAELSAAIERFGFPSNEIVVKPLDSNGMRGVRKLSSEGQTYEEFIANKPSNWSIGYKELLGIYSSAPEWPQVLVMPYFKGPEYSVDVFTDGRGLIVVPRLREKMVGGVTSVATLDFNRDILLFVQTLVERLNLRGLFGFQFILENGVPQLLESNPRVQGTMVASMASGVNILWVAVKALIGQEISDEEYLVEKNSGKFYRQWRGAFLAEDGTYEYI